MRGVYYQPPGAWFGDCMPFYEGGTFHLFHQRDTRRPGPFGEPFGWSLVRTTDFLRWEDLGEVLPPGGGDAQDQFVFAGSVFRAEGAYHAFYTGYNRTFAERGRPAQVLLRATSDDLVHWTRTALPVMRPPEGFDPDDWRDPFVLWDGERGSYLLILGARRLDGGRQLVGRTVALTSADLASWELEGDLWAPGLYSMHEMPDLFRLGPDWYLLTTEYSSRSKTIYRSGPSPRGPWSAPIDDGFDGRAYYAARSASDGARRYLFGWVPTKEGDQDLGDWQWGGTLLVHEIYRRPDGSLGVKVPEGVAGAFRRPRPVAATSVRLASVDARVERRLAQDAGDCFRLEATLRFQAGTRKVGFRVREDASSGEAYEFAIAPQERRLTFDRTGTYQWNACNTKGLDRYVDVAPGVDHDLQLVVDGTIATLYLDGNALTARMYASLGAGLAVDVVDGEVELHGVALLGL